LREKRSLLLLGLMLSATRNSTMKDTVPVARRL